MSWEEFLGYCSRPNGIAVAVGVLWSALVEYVPQFGALEPKIKRLVFVALSLVVPLLAAGLGILTTGWPAEWDATFWPAIVAGITAFAAGTAAHTRKL